ncbi:MAG TPA: LCP family protein [Nakamurella sp.]
MPAAYAGATPPGGPPPGPPNVPAPGGSGGDGSGRHRRPPGGVLAARIIALVAAVLVLVGCGIGWAFTGTLQNNSGTSDAANNAGNGGVISADGITILLVGSDARTDADGNPLSAEELQQVATEDDGGGVNTDTIMLVHIPQGGGKATAVSLPRDTWIGPKVMKSIVGPLPDGSEGTYDPNKINSYYSSAKAYTEQLLAKQGVTDKAQIERQSNEAGRTMLIRVVQAFTGMKIDHYAEVNLLGFYLLSNAIGGVPVCLNAAVNDPWSGADFPAGEQEVQGTAALSFVRQRHGLPGGDLDRVRRQQAFLSGAATKILSVGTLTNPGKLNDLVSAIDRSVIFDKDFSVLTFAEQIANLSSGNINFETLPTTGPEPSTDTDALATDPAQIKSFFAAISGGSAAGQAAAEPTQTVDPSTVTVDVQDGTIADGVTATASDIITKGGFTLGSLGVVPGTRAGHQQQTTEVHYPAAQAAAAQQVSDAFGVGETVQDNAIKSGHLLVVVGTDLKVPSGLRAPGAAFSVPAAAKAAVPAQAPAAVTLAAFSVPCVN